MIKDCKIIIRGFKDGSSNFWIGMKHYCLTSSNEVELCAGGIKTEEEVEALKAYIKRNKKVYILREESQLDKIIKEYNEIIPIGKFKGQSVSNVFAAEKKYLQWMLKEYNFLGKEKLKEQITEIFKT